MCVIRANRVLRCISTVRELEKIGGQSMFYSPQEFIVKIETKKIEAA